MGNYFFKNDFAKLTIWISLNKRWSWLGIFFHLLSNFDSYLMVDFATILIFFHVNSLLKYIFKWRIHFFFLRNTFENGRKIDLVWSYL